MTEMDEKIKEIENDPDIVWDLKQIKENPELLKNSDWKDAVAIYHLLTYIHSLESQLLVFKNLQDYWEDKCKQLEIRVKEFEIYIEQLRGALGYSVPGNIRENPNIHNGIAEALHKQVKELQEKLNKVVPIGLNLDESVEWIIARKEDLEEGIKNLIEAQDNYVQLLVDEINELVGIASVHGWKSIRHKEGIEHRELIAKLKEN